MDQALPSSGPRIADERLILLTPAAGAKVQALALREKQGSYLRVAITGGGCNGLAYKMRFIEAPKPCLLYTSDAADEEVIDVLDVDAQDCA